LHPFWSNETLEFSNGEVGVVADMGTGNNREGQPFAVFFLSINAGVIHSSGLKDLDFNPPTELDPGSGIPGDLINLLNEAINGSDFFTN
jgi:hypothetical protein